MDSKFRFQIWNDVPLNIFPTQTGGKDCGIWPICYINVLFSLTDPCQANSWIEAQLGFPTMSDIPELRRTYALQFQFHKAVQRKQLFTMKGNRIGRDQKLLQFLANSNITVGTIVGSGDCFIQSILAGVKQCYKDRGIATEFTVTSASLRQTIVDRFTQQLKNQ
jgi:hypothetical protein